jgi:hypothetical protein
MSVQICALITSALAPSHVPDLLEYLDQPWVVLYRSVYRLTPGLIECLGSLGLSTQAQGSGHRLVRSLAR